MQTYSNAFKNSFLSKMFFVSSLLILIYWNIARAVDDIYRFALVGAIFEILWVFAIAGLFGLPIAALIFWWKDKFNIRSFNLYTVVISTTTLVWMLLSI